MSVIAAPDVVARTVDPPEFLRFITGRLNETFVNSQEDLDKRLLELDLRPDPDGRYRVNEFWCRDNSWQATVVALMSRCDAVVMDVRGLTAAQRGIRFELEQLAARLPAERVVLVVDETTDRALIESATANGHGQLKLVRVERDSTVEIKNVFGMLLGAAQLPTGSDLVATSVGHASAG